MNKIIKKMKLHHLAIVVADIPRSTEVYQQLLNIEPVTDIIHDPRQKVLIQFLAGPALGDLQIELLSPTGQDSPVAQALEKGGGPNHMCFEVDDLEQTLRIATEKGYRVICPPVEAQALDKRRIAFVFTPDQQIVEFLETTLKTSR